MGRQISSWTIGELLHQMEYSHQATAEIAEGAQRLNCADEFRVSLGARVVTTCTVKCQFQ